MNRLQVGVLPVLFVFFTAVGCASGPGRAARDPLAAEAAELATASLSDAVDQVVGKRGGVEIRPGDIVAGDADGVVVVPAEHAEEVLKVARDLEEREAKTIRSVRELHSIRKAIEQHRRI